MSETVEFTTITGAHATGAGALPPGDGKAPALVLLQEYWGINDHIKSLVDRLAAAGFVVLAPDLYHGKVATDPTVAAQYMTELKWPEAMQMVAGAVKHLASHPRSNGHVGVMGFCMGGAGTLVAAGNVPGIGAAVAYYGIPPAGAVNWSALKVPVQTHVATRDQWVTVPGMTAVRDEVTAHGGNFEMHVYEADHAFVNDTRPVYNPEAAKLAWDRGLGFLRSHLAG